MSSCGTAAARWNAVTACAKAVTGLRLVKRTGHICTECGQLAGEPEEERVKPTGGHLVARPDDAADAPEPTPIPDDTLYPPVIDHNLRATPCRPVGDAVSCSGCGGPDVPPDADHCASCLEVVRAEVVRLLNRPTCWFPRVVVASCGAVEGVELWLGFLQGATGRELRAAQLELEALSAQEDDG